METEYAFCITQIGEKGSPERARADEVFKHVITPSVAKHGLSPNRSDLESTPGQVTKQIVQAIISSRVVIADLTGRNPNVYYELAIAHAFGRPTVVLVDTPASLSFDAQHERVISLGESDVLGATAADEARDRLDKFLETVLADGYRASNLVVDAATARSLDVLAPDDPIAQELATVRERLEDLAGLIAHRIPPASSASFRYGRDLVALRRFVESLADQDRIGVEELGELINDETSAAFDRWVTRLVSEER